MTKFVKTTDGWLSLAQVARAELIPFQETYFLFTLDGKTCKATLADWNREMERSNLERERVQLDWEREERNREWMARIAGVGLPGGYSTEQDDVRGSTAEQDSLPPGEKV